MNISRIEKWALGVALVASMGLGYEVSIYVNRTYATGTSIRSTDIKACVERLKDNAEATEVCSKLFAY